MKSRNNRGRKPQRGAGARAKSIRVRAKSGAYQVVCGAGAVRELGRKIEQLGKFSSVQILSSPKVWRAAGAQVTRGLRLTSRNVRLFDDDETKKTMRTVEEVCRMLTRAGADRKTLLVAVGGGVVGDVAGFVAASYLRGVALVHVPTTLVAQVDSAIGGKTGVNLPEGKNLVGAFYPPRLVVADTNLLSTLPQRQFRSGLAEVIKYGVIADREMFGFLEKNMEKVLARDAAALAYLIPRCAEIKAQVVSRDEREAGLREILNFGHTFGHALESVTRYRRYQHGEAVAWGMMAAALLGHEVRLMAADEAARVIGLVRRVGKLPQWPQVPAKKIIEAMRADKKAQAGKLRFVLSRRIGEAESRDDVPMHAVETVLNYFARHGADVLAGSRTLHG
jgi:3-dehydroquinate synthase